MDYHEAIITRIRKKSVGKGKSVIRIIRKAIIRVHRRAVIFGFNSLKINYTKDCKNEYYYMKSMYLDGTKCQEILIGVNKRSRVF